MMKSQGTLRIALSCAALLSSLSLVVYRQGRALEVLRELDATRREHVLLESRRATLSREIELLESRSRIVSVAGSMLGLHVPSGEEIVILQLPEGRGEEPARPAARVALAVRP